MSARSPNMSNNQLVLYVLLYGIIMIFGWALIVPILQIFFIPLIEEIAASQLGDSLSIGIGLLIVFCIFLLGFGMLIGKISSGRR